MGSIPGSGRPLGGMATHAGVLAWEIPRAEEAGALPSTGSRASDTGVRAQRCLCEGLRPPSHTNFLDDNEAGEGRLLLSAFALAVSSAQSVLP